MSESALATTSDHDAEEAAIDLVTLRWSSLFCLEDGTIGGPAVPLAHTGCGGTEGAGFEVEDDAGGGRGVAADDIGGGNTGWLIVGIEVGATADVG